MKNIGKLTSSLFCCLFISLMPTKGQDRVDYYLRSCKENPNSRLFVAYKSTKENDGRTRVEAFKYYDKHDTISFLRTYFFRENGQSLIRYVDYDDQVGQTFLKFQQDTSIVFHFNDPILDDSIVYQYLGKEILQKDSTKKEYHKFRVEKNGIVASHYLHDNFLLELSEWAYYDHYVIERVDSSQVPKVLREGVRNYKRHTNTTDSKIKEEAKIEEKTETCFWTDSTFSVYSIIILLFLICISFMTWNRLRHSKNKNT